MIRKNARLYYQQIIYAVHLLHEIIFQADVLKRTKSNYNILLYQYNKENALLVLSSNIIFIKCIIKSTKFL